MGDCEQPVNFAESITRNLVESTFCSLDVVALPWRAFKIEDECAQAVRLKLLAK
jgi:hypothetical protein